MGKSTLFNLLTGLNQQPENDEVLSHQETLRKLVQELKTPDLSPIKHDEILAQMQALLEDSD